MPGGYRFIKCYIMPHINILPSILECEAFEDLKISFPFTEHVIYWVIDRTFIIKCWCPKWNNDYRIIFTLKLKKKDVTTRTTVWRSAFIFYSFFPLKCQSLLKNKAKVLSCHIFLYLTSTQTSESFFPKHSKQDSWWILRVII